MLGNLTGILRIERQIIVINKNKTSSATIQHGIVRKRSKAVSPCNRKHSGMGKSVFFKDNGLFIRKNNHFPSKTCHGFWCQRNREVKPRITLEAFQSQRRRQKRKAPTCTPYRKRK